MAQILVVEDSPSLNRLMVLALETEGYSVAPAHGCDEAFDGLTPDTELILLDLNLPRKDGREVLSAIKSDDKLKRIPVVILTTSQAEEDILRAYHLNANCYISKPVDLDQFIKVVRTIEDFWLTIVKLPAV